MMHHSQPSSCSCKLLHQFHFSQKELTISYSRADENYNAGCALADTLLDPVTKDSVSPTDSSFSRALKYNGSLWDWYKNIDPSKGRRFEEAMIGFGSVLNYDAILNGGFVSDISSIVPDVFGCIRISVEGSTRRDKNM